MDVPWSVLRRALDLDAVENALGLEVTRIGEEDVASCPLPNHPGADENPSFSIKNTTYAWHCFTCDEGGALWQLVAAVNGTDYDGAISWLLPFADELELTDTDNDKWLARIEKRLAVPEVHKVQREPALPWFPLSRLDYWRGQIEDTDYFNNRGINEGTQQLYHLGYDKGYYHKRWGGKSQAVIIPHFFHGELVGWQVRTLEDKKPKYVNSDDFPKKDTLFNWDLALRDPNRAFIVVESPMTVLRLHSLGLPALATFGGSISDRQIELLRTRDGPLYLAYDNDETGQKAVRSLTNALQEHVNCYIVPAPESEKADLGDLPWREVQTLIGSAEPSFLVFPMA